MLARYYNYIQDGPGFLTWLGATRTASARSPRRRSPACSRAVCNLHSNSFNYLRHQATDREQAWKLNTYRRKRQRKRRPPATTSARLSAPLAVIHPRELQPICLFLLVVRAVGRVVLLGLTQRLGLGDHGVTVERGLRVLARVVLLVRLDVGRRALLDGNKTEVSRYSCSCC